MSSRHALRGGTAPVVSGQAHFASLGRRRWEEEWGLCPPVCLRYTDQGGEEEEDYESEEQLQHRILTAALEFVPAHGWTAEAIAEGAQVCVGVGRAAWPGSAGGSHTGQSRGPHTLPAQLRVQEPLTAIRYSGFACFSSVE